MRVYYGFDNLEPIRNPVVTVGSYDGVHAGHRELLEHIKEMAREVEGESVVITFSPHPQTVLGNRGERIKIINSLAEKIMLFESIKIDVLIIAPFTEEFSRLSSYDYVRDFLIMKVGTHTLVIGYNHHFGFNREGDFSYLQQLQSEFRFNICEVQRKDIDKHKVSSTVIRHLISEGEMDQAAKFLGYNYFIVAKLDHDNRVTLDDPFKLTPPAGTYRIQLWQDGYTSCRSLYIEGGEENTQSNNNETDDAPGMMTLSLPQCPPQTRFPPVSTPPKGYCVITFC